MKLAKCPVNGNCEIEGTLYTATRQPYTPARFSISRARLTFSASVWTPMTRRELRLAIS